MQEARHTQATRRKRRIWRNVHLATFDPAQAPSSGYNEITNGALVERNGVIQWLGREADLPAAVTGIGTGTEQATEQINGQGGWLLPGFIDCHTHLVFAGQRAGEFEQRLTGVRYETLAQAGGGILGTVRATRAASEQQLFELAQPRLEALLQEGVTGLEIKSGYGLELQSERKQLRVATRLAEHYKIRVQRTFLGAHTLPVEYQGQSDVYIEHLCARFLPFLVAENLVDAVDGFCDTVGFSPRQIARLLQAAQALGLAVKLHAEQLSDQGGAELAASFGALSADHLEYLTPQGVLAMARAGTTAVLLPGAYYFLRQQTPPPLAQLREAGVPIALATDANPGSSPLFSLRLMLNLACTLWGITPAEALCAVTRNAARALGWLDVQGTLSVGKRADLVLWPIDTPAELAYQLGALNPLMVCVAGSTAGLGGQPA